MIYLESLISIKLQVINNHLNKFIKHLKIYEVHQHVIEINLKKMVV